MTTLADAPNKSADLTKKSKEAAKSAGLVYVSDTSSGIRRIRSGKNSRYETATGNPVKDEKTLGRIKSLVIPPAWEDVWICPQPNGHLQAVGIDARGRKQYRYHPRWREVRDADKYDKMTDFARALPQIRRKTAKHLAMKGLPREKVLAAVVRVMEKTLIRVGNDEYVRQNDSYGLTTLRDHHAKIRGKKVVLEFRGKSGVEHEIDFEDPRLAKVVEKCQDLPGEELFQYVDDAGKVRDIGSSDVNNYLREITGQDFTAKDFRTWAGTVLAATALKELEAFDTQAAAKKNVVRAVETVAKRLGNTKAVCRKCYIHPAIINSYLDGSLAERLGKQASGELARAAGKLPAEEAAVLGVLQNRLRRKSGNTRVG